MATLHREPPFIHLLSNQKIIRWTNSSKSFSWGLLPVIYIKYLLDIEYLAKARHVEYVFNQRLKVTYN